MNGEEGLPIAPGKTEATGVTSMDADKGKLKVIKTRANLIKTQIKGGQDPEKIDGYLGRGRHGIAYLIEGKVAKINDLGTQDVEEETKRLEKVKGIPRTIQLVDADVEEGIIITELLPGEHIMQ